MALWEAVLCGHLQVVREVVVKPMVREVLDAESSTGPKASESFSPVGWLPLPVQPLAYMTISVILNAIINPCLYLMTIVDLSGWYSEVSLHFESWVCECPSSGYMWRHRQSAETL